MHAVDNTGHAPVLVIQRGNTRYSFYLLNPGQLFRGFGGSTSGLLVQKTASLIVRREHSGGDTLDTEYDITHTGMWQWVQGIIDHNEVEVAA